MTELFQEEQPPEEDFNDIVDMDDKHVEDFTSKELVGSMVESTYFRIFIFALIVINSILIGLQTDEGLVCSSAEMNLYFAWVSNNIKSIRLPINQRACHINSALAAVVHSYSRSSSLSDA